MLKKAAKAGSLNCAVVSSAYPAGGVGKSGPLPEKRYFSVGAGPGGVGVGGGGVGPGGVGVGGVGPGGPGVGALEHFQLVVGGGCEVSKQSSWAPSFDVHHTQFGALSQVAEVNSSMHWALCERGMGGYFVVSVTWCEGACGGAGVHKKCAGSSSA